MNTPTFKSHSVTCPICNSSSALPPAEMFNGLFTCPHCHSHLVITWSGHYVRDPFAVKQLSMGQSLRRQSRPLARLRRDLCRQYLPMLAIAGSVVFLGLTISSLEVPNTSKNLWDGFVEWAIGEENLNDLSPQ